LRARAKTRLGNIFAVRPGKKGGPPTYAGSHLDTQVHIPTFKQAEIDKLSLLVEGMMEF
jgi:acetylornithine deacetylase/succinyl-diaminopimelate desuccinylase-like protein